MKRLACLLVLVLGVCGLATGCATQHNAKSFSNVSAPGWVALEVRDNIDYDHAWKATVGLLVREHDYDIEFMAREEGYIRTAWTYAWSRVFNQTTRVRVTVKFADDHKSVAIKSEAQVLLGTEWLWGVDTQQLTTLKTDMMGTIGRTAK